MTVQVRELTVNELSDVASIHMKAFPNSALTLLGHETVRRYYLWQIIGRHGTLAIGTYVAEKMIGFCFGGSTSGGALSGFLKKNWRFLVIRVLRRPRLIVSNTNFRQRLRQGARILTKRQIYRKGSSAQASVLPRRRSFGILSIAVDPAYQGSGAGQALMSYTRNSAQERGFEQMHLTVHTNNTKAINFYELQGWQKTIIDDKWNGHMTKKLESLE